MYFNFENAVCFNRSSLTGKQWIKYCKEFEEKVYTECSAYNLFVLENPLQREKATRRGRQR